jgi:hypothetical protein
MTTQANKELARRWHERGLGAGDVECADALFAPAFTTQPAGRRSSTAQAKEFVAALRAALPDLTVAMETLIA